MLKSVTYHSAFMQIDDKRKRDRNLILLKRFHRPTLRQEFLELKTLDLKCIFNAVIYYQYEMRLLNVEKT